MNYLLVDNNNWWFVLTSMLVLPSMPKGEIFGSCCHWFQWFDWLISSDCLIDWYDEYGSMSYHWYMIHDEDGSMWFHWYMMHYWKNVYMTHYCLIMIDKVHKWMNSKVVPLWWNPSWEDVLQLSYPRSMVGEPILICGIMRLRSLKLLVKLSYMDSDCHIIYGGMWNVT